MDEEQLIVCVKKLREYADDLYNSLRNYSLALSNLAYEMERAMEEER